MTECERSLVLTALGVALGCRGHRQVDSIPGAHQRVRKTARNCTLVEGGARRGVHQLGVGQLPGHLRSHAVTAHVPVGVVLVDQWLCVYLKAAGGA